MHCGMWVWITEQKKDVGEKNGAKLKSIVSLIVISFLVSTNVLWLCKMLTVGAAG